MTQAPEKPAPHTVSAVAPGKVILVGEHAVVYGRPAIAVPVWQTVATATVVSDTVASGTVASGTVASGTVASGTVAPVGTSVKDAPAHGLTLIAQDIGRAFHLAALDAAPEPRPNEDPLVLVARRTLAELGLPHMPAWRVILHSQIPMASGLGSGAALCAALAKALWQMAAAQTLHTDSPIPAPDPARISALVYAAEQIYHGTPSGIDNTVVAYGKPIWFRKGEPPQIFTAPLPFRLAIADSGKPGATRATVAHVRRLWAAHTARIDAIFTAIEGLVIQARTAVERGDPAALGPIFDANHAWLQELEVSTPELDRLVQAARGAGAQGAKLSGGGGGGNIIALVDGENQDAVAAALTAAGARRIILTQVGRRAAAPDRADRPPDR